MSNAWGNLVLLIWYIWCVWYLWHISVHLTDMIHMVHIVQLVLNPLFTEINCKHSCIERNMPSRELCVWEIVLLSREAHHGIALTPGQRTEMDWGADWGRKWPQNISTCNCKNFWVVQKDSGNNWRCDEFVSKVFLHSGTPMVINERAFSRTAVWKDR